jgi:NMD protein affecting ribosome stability and mRNA decay
MSEVLKIHRIKRGDACPECGRTKARHELMCRECYRNSGGLGPRVHHEIFGGGEMHLGHEWYRVLVKTR